MKCMPKLFIFYFLSLKFPLKCEEDTLFILIYSPFLSTHNKYPVIWGCFQRPAPSFPCPAWKKSKMVDLTSWFWHSFSLNLENLGRMKLEKVSYIVCPKPCFFPKFPDCGFDASFPLLGSSSGKPVVRAWTAHQQDSFIGFKYYWASSIVVCAWNIFFTFCKTVEF